MTVHTCACVSHTVLHTKLYCLFVCFFCSKIIGHVISDVYQYAQSGVASLWTICCQLLQTGLLRIKQVFFWEATQ